MTRILTIQTHCETGRIHRLTARHVLVYYDCIETQFTRVINKKLSSSNGLIGKEIIRRLL